MRPCVETSYGPVLGQRQGHHVRFLGIPFARPPIPEARRFLPPEPPTPWREPRDAGAYGPSAIQGAAFAPGVMAEGPQSEDCLTLNVFAPAGMADKPRPVMVWLHGGAFIVGTSATPLYDGGRLVERGDVVVVTLNYRLGALGFLMLGEEGATWGAAPNLGLHDQIAALRWVQQEIPAFGGDPARITLFGESAGATSVLALMASPLAQGLFQRAIVQSPAPVAPQSALDHAPAVADQLLTACGLDRSRSQRLQQVPLERLRQAQLAIQAPRANWPHFQPLAGDVVLPEAAESVFASGRSAPVPLLIGYNRDEWNLFDAHRVMEWFQPLDDGEALARLRARFPRAEPARVEALLACYRQCRRGEGLPADNRALLRAIDGDLLFRWTAIRFAELHAAHDRPVFVYTLTHESPALQGALGACHALELPLVFGTLEAPNVRPFVGSGPQVEALSQQMMDAWLHFAHHGEPGAGEAGPWPAFTGRARGTMVFGAASGLADDPLGEERQALQHVLAGSSGEA